MHFIAENVAFLSLRFHILSAQMVFDFNIYPLSIKALQNFDEAITQNLHYLQFRRSMEYEAPIEEKKERRGFIIQIFKLTLSKMSNP
jgi:hypothetical protein